MCLALVLAMLAPALASAQQRNPYADLFGRATSREGKEFSAIHFRSSALAQRGWTLEQEFVPPDRVVPEGIAAGADASVLAQYVRPRAQLIAQGRYSYQEYRQEPAFGTPAYDAGLRATFRPRTRIGFEAGAAYSRSPYYQLMWIGPDLGALQSPLPANGVGVLMLENDALEASAGITSYYTSRSSLQLTGVYRQADFENTPQHDFSSIGGELRWRRQVSRDLAVHAAYGREEQRQQFSSSPLYTNDRIDVGVEYGRSLTLARRTFFSFGTQTAMLRENDGPQRFRFNGEVTLDHRFARSWEVQLAARRGSDFLPGFRGVVLSDHASAMMAGYLAKRVLFNMYLDGARGEAGLSDPRKFISYTGTTRLTFAVTRHFGVFGQYLYYRYQVPADPLNLSQIPRGARQAVSFGVETWVPIFDKEKVTSDSR